MLRSNHREIRPYPGGTRQTEHRPEGKRFARNLRKFALATQARRFDLISTQRRLTHLYTGLVPLSFSPFRSFTRPSPSFSFSPTHPSWPRPGKRVAAARKRVGGDCVPIDMGLWSSRRRAGLEGVETERRGV